MPPLRALRALAATAVLLVSHQLTYLSAYRSPATRAAMLHATGHSWYLPTAVLSAGSTLIMLAVVRRSAQLHWKRRYSIEAVATGAVGLAVVEVSERIAVGAPLHELIEHLLPYLVLSLVAAAPVAPLLARLSIEVQQLRFSFPTLFVTVAPALTLALCAPGALRDRYLGSDHSPRSPPVRWC